MRGILQIGRRGAVMNILLILLLRTTCPVLGQGDFSKEEHPKIVGSINNHLPKIKSWDIKDRNQALIRLQSELSRLGNERIRPQAETRRALAKALIAKYAEIKQDDPDSQQARQLISELIAADGDNEIGKSFILKVLDTCPDKERRGILIRLGPPGGISGDDMYDKVNDLAQKKLIPIEFRTELLARVDKARALPEIMADIKSSQDKSIFLHSARALQDYYRRPEDYRVILPRVKELRLDKEYNKEGNGLYWIDEDLLKDYIETAYGDDLRIGLELMNEDGSLISIKAVPIFMRTLSNDDPKVRSLAAAVLAKVAESGEVDIPSIVASIKTASAKETDPEAKRAMENAIKNIERFKDAWQEMLKRNNLK